MVQADAIVERLRALAPAGVAGAAPAQASGAAAGPATEPMPPLPPRPTRRLPAMSVPVVLLSLGALCLLVAGVVFVAVTWSALGLTGRAENLPDGSVLVHAAGPPAALDALVEWLHRGPPMARVDAVEVEEIDRVNILRATHLGMQRAVAGLTQQPEAVLIDGLPVPGFPLPQEALVKGDARSFSIAAASVIAKVTRDRYMRSAAALHPQYGFERHKGYGTPEHLEALRLHGPCPLHRRSFSPVTQLTFAFEED